MNAIGDSGKFFGCFSFGNIDTNERHGDLLVFKLIRW